MESARFSKDTYFVLEDVGPREALFSFGFASATKVRLVVRAEDGSEAASETGERNLCGRLRVGGLAPEQVQTARCIPDRPMGDPDPLTIRFRTPAEHDGEAMAAFAVLADPHVSIDRENRRGRLFLESRHLLADALEDARGCSAVLMPGDITDAGKSQEFTAARRILSRFGGRVLAVPGDHDSGCKSGGERPSQPPVFPVLPFQQEWQGMRILGLDTSPGKLGPAQLDLLGQVLSQRGRLLILSHHDLLHNPAIVDDESSVTDHGEAARLLERSAAEWVMYAGHKNVPLTLRSARGIQVNVPQLCHYPAAFLRVTVYADRLSHRFVPIRSEILREYSLRMLRHDESPAMAPAYRYGCIEARSFEFTWSDP